MVKEGLDLAFTRTNADGTFVFGKKGSDACDICHSKGDDCVLICKYREASVAEYMVDQLFAGIKAINKEW